MSEDFVLNATSREDAGKGASRRLRRLDGQVPAIVYGGKKKPANISVSHKDLTKQLENEAFFSHIISLVIDDKAEDVILKDLQRHPAKPQIVHADFMRVSKTKKLNTSVPLHFLNEDTSKGVKMQGGNIVHNMVQLEISCLPADLPEFIEVDLKDVEVGQVVHISDIQLPKGVTSVALSHGEDHDLPVVAINKPKGGTDDDEAEGEDAEGDSE
ncbi:50S ribosomal protein L25/general stress protein Ctc [Gilvimarinus sp. DA14]|uniref:50S ribosomal protein L25/general stress protein Ctc n=1 Tax=Gilvimarinus sp. DA14 TaxID=2956798 RepID=UPI0020B71B46|nr:50S ribosomal protein L25/general stress protein Ctc [Gilvimarinus sp. DA14]UTF61325.1 50S ribosomal protein L25/general stress protein Ctc [Gilvimarinus sp. DA14]